MAALTGEFLLRDFTSAEGAFISSWDADSEGHEGLYYLWTPGPAARGAGTERVAAAVANAASGSMRPANFEGRWHLRVVQ